ncbi:DoxX family protein [Actinoplanes sp. KI2]|uniref:DoxX family protein n=1 Tax=Actinoplanes sp. KI2 TaxID=2983315 RepID=UPI00294FFE91|nr:DoxX family protein [Actinoplanes sp. KI2]
MLSSRLSGPVLSAFRVVVGLLFACHGAASLFGVLGGVRGTGATVRFPAWPGWWAAAIEFAGGSLVLLGLFTRWAALVCSGAMAYAYFTVHQPRSLWPLNNGGELAVLYCWSFLTIAVLGAGAWSLDGLFSSPTVAAAGKWRDDAARTLHRHGAQHVSETLGGRRSRMAPSAVRRSSAGSSRPPHRGQRAAGRPSFRRTRREPC